MSGPVRVGIVGASTRRGWARDAHLPALRSLPGFRIEAVSARTAAAAREAAEAFGAARGFGDSLEMVRDAGIDLVAVTVKVPEHRAVVLAALAAGKHVLCEWPLGRDLDEAQEMAAAVRPGTRAVIGLQALAAPAVREAAALIRAGRIGRPLVARAFNAAAAWGEATTEAEAYLQDPAHGATLETIGGGHALAVLEALVGPYAEVDARATTRRARVPVADGGREVARGCADHLLVLGRHAGGCVSAIEVSGGRTERPASFEIEGERGVLRLVGRAPGTCQIAALRLETGAGEAALPEAAPGLSGPPANVAAGYAALAADLAAGIRTVPDFEAAVRLGRLLDAIADAARTGARRAPDRAA